jgi:ABC-2 type transport system permease protein
MKYIRLYLELIRQSFMKAMAYKANFIIVLISNLAYFVIQLYFMKIIFTEVDTIAGWNKYEMFFYIGTFAIIDALWVFGPYFNLTALPDMIRSGSLDGYLLKPVSSQFLVSLRKVDIGSLFSMIAGVGIVVYAVIYGNIKVSLIGLVFYIIAIIHALFVEYSIYLIMLCLAFWMVKVDFADVLHGIICYFSNKPADIYRGIIRKIITSVLPYGFLMTIASKTALGKVDKMDYLSAIITSWCFLLLSIIVWKVSSKRYGSASS